MRAVGTASHPPVARRLLGLVALALALISGLVLMAVRSLRGNALVRRALEEAYQLAKGRSL